MLTSVRWLNDYLDPPASAEEQAELLTRAGFPLEGTEAVEFDDVRQDFEMTSNRGDCVCHFGLAREIAAISGRSLKTPAVEPKPSGPSAAEIVSVTNHEPDLCPLYTARVIRGVTVGPSPDWLRERLIARGDIPRNNVVDATNFVLFELGQPTHVFDLAKLGGRAIHIRRARRDEAFLPIGEGAKPVKLTPSDLVIADDEIAVAMAGVKGGTDSAVTDATTDIVIEAATFNPVGVRNSSRRHNIASDSSYRFERGVHPAQVNAAAERLAALILELAGGTLCEGVVSDGAAIPEPRTATMRPARCRRLLGIEINDEQMLGVLDRLGFRPRLDGDVIHCTVPFHRLDIEREIDLIEEICRMYGLDRFPVTEKMAMAVTAPQPTELARRAVHDTLVGLDFIESITHSLVSEQAATPFLPKGASLARVDDDRAKAEPILRPSLLPSLLRVRAHNAHGGVHDLRLFESTSTFRRQTEGGRDEGVEQNMLALLADCDDAQEGFRTMRGIIERLALLLRGPEGCTVSVVADDGATWFTPGARVRLGTTDLGRMGIISADVTKTFDVDGLVVAAELTLPALYGTYPPESEAQALPHFPAIERDVSAIVAEDTAWDVLRSAIEGLELDWLETVAFVTTYRDEKIGAGRKSVTLRCRFRATDHTLTHEQIDPLMTRVQETLTRELDAEIRG